MNDVTEPSEKIDPRKGSCAFTYIDVGAIAAGRIAQAQTVYPDKAPSRAKQLVQRGDTLFSGVRVYLRNIALVEDTHDGAIASTAFCVLRPSPVLDEKYLYWFANWQKFVNLLLPLQRGNSPPAVLDSDVKAQEIPLPPVPEQRRIVARIDELFVEIAEGEAALKRARQGLDTLRRALLKAAVTGELTRDWREANRLAETGADLLARIRTKHSNSRFRNGRARASSVPEALDINLLPELPEGWAWARVGEIVSDSLIGLDRNAAAQREGSNGTPYIKMNNISMEGVVEAKDLVRTSVNSAEISRYRVIEGDVFFNTRNSRELVGKTGIIKEITEDTIFNNNILRMRFHNGINPEFISIQMCSPVFRKNLEQVKRATTSVAAVYLGDLLILPVAIPSAAEQREIVSAVEFHTDRASDAVTLVERTKRTDRLALRQSILKAAFEGRLVPQDTADEPASALLARLRGGSGGADAPRGRRARKRNRPDPLELPLFAAGDRGSAADAAG